LLPFFIAVSLAAGVASTACDYSATAYVRNSSDREIRVVVNGDPKRSGIVQPGTEAPFSAGVNKKLKSVAIVAMNGERLMHLTFEGGRREDIEVEYSPQQ
jgi:hypothetical protein